MRSWLGNLTVEISRSDLPPEHGEEGVIGMNRIQNVLRAIMPAGKKKSAAAGAQTLTSRDISTSLTMMTMHARSIM